MGTADRVERVLAPVVASCGLELVDVEAQSGRVRVTVDRVGGIDLDTIGSATNAISHALDDADAVPGGRYELEVSSPGVERRLRRPEHFAAQLGARISVKTKPGTEGERRLEGELTAADGKGFVLEDESILGGRREFAYEEVERAVTVFDWKAALAGTRAPSAKKDHKAARRQVETARHEREEQGHGTETR